jgi:hypothetical protein
MPKKASAKDMDASRQIFELKRQLLGWGLKPTQSEEHEQVFYSMVQAVCDIQSGEFLFQQEDYPQKLKQDPLESMHEVFRQELGALLDKSEGISTMTDHLKERFPNLPRGPPFLHDKRTNTLVFSKQYSKCGIHENDADIDPLKRFTFARTPPTKLLYQQYVMEMNHGEFAIRAIVAHYACLKGK